VGEAWAAWAATRKKGSYPGVLYRRIRARRGHQKAVVAVAHQILAVIHPMLRDNQPYEEPGVASYNQKRKPEITRRLVQRLERPGYQVTLEIPPIPKEIQSFTPPPETGPWESLSS
jgi:transposase